METEITPTSYSVRNGYDLSIRQHAHAWAKSDLTPLELCEVAMEIIRFIGAPPDVNGLLQPVKEAYIHELMKLLGSMRTDRKTVTVHAEVDVPPHVTEDEVVQIVSAGIHNEVNSLIGWTPGIVRKEGD